MWTEVVLEYGTEQNAGAYDKVRHNGIVRPRVADGG